MSEIIYLVIAITSGGILGFFYFYGLWWTVQKMGASRNPYRLMLLSFFVRTLIVMGGFYLLLLLEWTALATGVLGFILSRSAIIRSVGLTTINIKEYD